MVFIKSSVSESIGSRKRFPNVQMCIRDSIYDPPRGSVFSHFGLHTICPNNLSVDAIYSMLTDHDKVKNVYLDSATVSFDAAEPQPRQVGMRLRELCAEDSGRQVLFGLLHADGNLTLAHANAEELVGQNDRLLYAKVID